MHRLRSVGTMHNNIKKKDEQAAWKSRNLNFFEKLFDFTLINDRVFIFNTHNMSSGPFIDLRSHF